MTAQIIPFPQIPRIDLELSRSQMRWLEMADPESDRLPPHFRLFHPVPIRTIRSLHWRGLIRNAERSSGTGHYQIWFITEDGKTALRMARKGKRA